MSFNARSLCRAATARKEPRYYTPNERNATNATRRYLFTSSSNDRQAAWVRRRQSFATTRLINGTDTRDGSGGLGARLQRALMRRRALAVDVSFHLRSNVRSNKGAYERQRGLARKTRSTNASLHTRCVTMRGTISSRRSSSSSGHGTHSITAPSC